MTSTVLTSQVLVLATNQQLTAFDASDGRVLWQHSSDRGWPVVGVPRLARLDGDVFVVCAGRNIAWVRLQDGAVFGRDTVWFDIERLVVHGSTVVLRGANDLACYRNGAAAWGLRFVPEFSGAGEVWMTDAAGNRTRPTGWSRLDSAAVLLGAAW